MHFCFVTKNQASNCLIRIWCDVNRSPKIPVGCTACRSLMVIRTIQLTWFSIIDWHGIAESKIDNVQRKPHTHPYNFYCCFSTTMILSDGQIAELVKYTRHPHSYFIREKSFHYSFTLTTRYQNRNPVSTHFWLISSLCKLSLMSTTAYVEGMKMKMKGEMENRKPAFAQSLPSISIEKMGMVL